MADQLYSFHFRASDPNSWEAAQATSMDEFVDKRSGGGSVPAMNVIIFFDPARSLYFVNPYFRKEVNDLVKAAFKMKPKVDPQVFIYTWKFKKESDLDVFDEYHSSLSDQYLLKIDDRVRKLLPQGVRSFLKLHNIADADLEAYTFCHQHFPARREKRLDSHTHHAERLFEAIESLRKAGESASVENLVRASRNLQEVLNKRILSLSEGEEGPVSSEGRPHEERSEEEERSPPAPDLSDARFRPRSLLEEEKLKKKSVDKMLKNLFSHQCRIKNSFGNILTSAGDATILGGDLPSVTISHEVARSLACWDFDTPLDSEGDLANEKLLRMISKGPTRKGGAWTLHLWFNKALSLPASGFETLPMAREWLETNLVREALAYFKDKHGSLRDGGGSSVASLACDELEPLLRRALETRRLLREVLEEAESSSDALRWLLETRDLIPGRVPWVDAIQRHAMTGDLAMVVRHPITQPVPRFLLMVDETLSGWSIRYPPQFVDHIGADYDGDKVELAIQKSERKQDVCRVKLSIPRLCFNALGKQIAKLTGTAPLALRLMQSNGASHPDVYGLEKGTRSSRVIWPGVLETTYSPSVFFEALEAMGVALPRLLKPWRRPMFEEVSFEVHLPDGTALRSLDLEVSYDGFYPVELEARDCDKEAWIRSELLSQADALPKLKGFRSFSVKLSGTARPSALDNLTFSQMLSLVFAFVPSNFEREDGKVQVAHVPGLIEKGVVRASDRSFPSPWHRLARALLRIGSTPEVREGKEAVALELRRFSWKPSYEEVEQCLLENKDPVLRELLLLPDSLADPCKLRSLVLSKRRLLEERGHHRALQILDCFFFPKTSTGGGVEETSIRALWQDTNLGEHWRLSLVPWEGDELPGEQLSEWAAAEAAWKGISEKASLSESEEDEAKEVRLRLEATRQVLQGLLESLRLIVERGPPMSDADWLRLEASVHRVKAVQQVRHLLLQERRSTTAEKRQPLLDWVRFVACVQTPKRIAVDVVEILNAASPLCRDERDYCMILTNLEALGQKFGTFLNQPKQRQIILEEDLQMRIANFGLREVVE